MRWWARSHALPAYVVTLVAAIGLSAALGNATFLFPSLRAGGSLGSTEFANVLACAPVLVWLWGRQRGDGARESVSLVPWRLFWLDALIPLASTVLAVAVWLIAPGPLSEIFARNLAASYGLAMIAFAVGAGRYAFIAPAGYLVAAMLLGFGPLSFGEPDAWAAIVAVNEDEVIRLAALAVFGLGFTALFVRSTIRWALR